MARHIAQGTNDRLQLIAQELTKSKLYLLKLDYGLTAKVRTSSALGLVPSKTQSMCSTDSMDG